MKAISVSGNLTYSTNPARNIVRSFVHLSRVAGNPRTIGTSLCNSGLSIVSSSWILHDGNVWWYRYTEPMSFADALAFLERAVDVSDYWHSPNNVGMGFNVVIRPRILDKLTGAQFTVYLAAN